MGPRVYGWWLAFLVVMGGCTATAGVGVYFILRVPDEAPPASPLSEKSIASPLQIETYCSKCHAYPPPDSFPRSAWKEEIEKAYKIIAMSNLSAKPPALDQVLKHYEERAPLELPFPAISRATSPLPLRFRQMECPALPQVPDPAISNVNLVHLFDERRLDVLACDMRAGLVMALSPYAPSPAWQVLGKVPNPAHAEVVDLDGDGIKDILVANLGSMEPADHYDGSVVWLRGGRDGRFTPITILKDVGRVADVQAADFGGAAKLDLIVAVFGWRTMGEVLYLEN